MVQAGGAPENKRCRPLPTPSLLLLSTMFNFDEMFMFNFLMEEDEKQTEESFIRDLQRVKN